MLSTLTLISYFSGAAAQALTLLRTRKYAFLLLLAFGIPAIIGHGFFLYHVIDIGGGQNLTAFNLLSLAMWVISGILMLLAFRKPTSYLAIAVFPLAAISILLAVQYPSTHIIQTGSDAKQLLHILLSVITFSTIVIAGLQAIILAIQEKFLKQKYFEIARRLPPIETTEKFLFQMIATGAILLSLVLITSFYFFHGMMIHHFLQKTILTLLAWFVFTLLLVGRYFFGWRGRMAIYCTLSGVAILSIIYFSSMLIMECIP